MVAKVRSLSSRSRCIFSSCKLSFGDNSLISDGDKLKNAISDPLANPDISKSSIASIADITTPKLGAIK